LRFATVFDQTYTRFLDLQKAEAQAREAQIEAALERVRSKTMGMQRSEQLAETASLLFKQIGDLGLNVWSSGFQIWNADDISTTAWMRTEGGEIQAGLRLPHTEDPFFKNIYNARHNADRFFVMESKGQELEETYRYMFNIPEWKKAFGDIEASGFPIPKYQITHCVYFAQGYLMLITHESYPEYWDIFKRFGKVFEQTYTRFLDLQKAETQAREALIEAALERVRSRTMAMQHSSELADTSFLLAKQVRALNIKAFGCAFNIFDEDQKSSTEWFSNEEGYQPTYKIPREGIFLRYYEAAQRGESLHVEEIAGEACAAHYRYLSTLPVLGDIIKKYVESSAVPTFQIDHVAYFKYGYLLFVTYEPVPEAHEIFKRFAKVFEQTYTRFLDLQKAEAQAREAQIQLALERVRARTMAMQKSDELADVASVLFQQVRELGIKTWTTGFNVWLNNDTSYQDWITSPQGGFIEPYIIDAIQFPVFMEVMQAKQRGDEFLVQYLEGELLKETYKQLSGFAPRQFEKMLEDGFQFPSHQYDHFVFGKSVSLMFITFQPVPQAHNIFKRFGREFEKTYTRFLDLQKAEGQAREARIGAALERVRTRTMAMQRSEELEDVATMLFQAIRELGIETWTTGFNVWLDDDTAYQDFVTNPEGGFIKPYIIDLTQFPAFIEIREAKLRGDHFYVRFEAGDTIKETYQHLMLYAPEQYGKLLEDGFQFPLHQYEHFVFGKTVSLMFITYEPVPEAHDIFKRFGKVFEQTYTRFLDLQKAEAQARDAQIEASLERVRGKAMAMHSSEDLAATIGIFYRELESFSITPRRCGVGLLDRETRIAELSTINTTEHGESIEIIGKLKMEGHPVLESVFDNWIIQKEYHPILRGNEIKEYYQLLRPQISFPEYPNDAVQYGYFFYFPEGGVYAWTEKELTEDELKIYRRFTSVLTLTYKRYKDLKDSEVRTKEAVKQATLDRVRAEIASMRTKQDLDRITPLIWNELSILGIPFVRCGVFIMDDAHQQVHTFLSTPDGKALAAFHLDYAVSNLQEMITSWHDRQVYITHWGEKEFGELADTLVKQGSIGSRDQYLSTLPPDGIHLHLLPFMQGMLYVGNTKRLQQEDIDLLQSLAEAFSTAYARYEDFKKLEAAKQQVDHALVELRQTQQQLVQAEKMASLGELTAGIAHEIQNPLNFVNNFSEVSNELIDEMVEEVKKGNFDDAKSIANDLKQNLEKINHHGKRAAKENQQTSMHYVMNTCG
jgi:hypothetical protein